ncbi:MAG: uracil-DNA glycosylase [bacterium]|nr:uracil-DNA glycosylase [bacterium]
MSKNSIKIEESWLKVLQEEFESEYFKKLAEFVRGAYLTAKIFPPPKLVFRAFEMCPFDKVKVVILGQDPYHGLGQAHGLCFSVPENISTPPSLQNIYKEICKDVGGEIPKHGNLENWAKQGVLLLNSTLTVEAGKAGSHQGKGWEEFTDSVIKKISDEKENVVFILWGNYARKKRELIDSSKHLILEAAHPSPFSAYNGFFGCKHFSKANEYLKTNGKAEVVWV